VPQVPTGVKLRNEVSRASVLRLFFAFEIQGAESTPWIGSQLFAATCLLHLRHVFILFFFAFVNSKTNWL
jgi:hypothetical protein